MSVVICPKCGTDMDDLAQCPKCGTPNPSPPTYKFTIVPPEQIIKILLGDEQKVLTIDESLLRSLLYSHLLFELHGWRTNPFTREIENVEYVKEYKQVKITFCKEKKK